jgi:hypothetical protein
MTYDRALTLFHQHLSQETFHPQPASDWTGNDPLPVEIATYYEYFGPEGVEMMSFSDPIFLPSLRDLWPDQEPYQFDITTWERQTTWHDDWFFLADLQNDEYGHLVFDSSTGQVLKVTYDEPGWISRPLFRDLETMVLALAILATPVTVPQVSDPTAYAAEVHAILDQLREFLSEKELRTILTELSWKHVLQDI